MSLPEIIDLIIYFTVNPIIELCLVSKYWNDNVKKIRITSNRLYPKMKDEHLFLLSNLTELDLNEQLITDQIINPFGMKRMLKTTRTKGITDYGIRNLTNLTILSLSRNDNITDKGISNLTNLTSLNLSNNVMITDHGISNLTNLVYLDITTCRTVSIDRIDERFPKLYSMALHDGKGKFFPKNLRRK